MEAVGSLQPAHPVTCDYRSLVIRQGWSGGGGVGVGGGGGVGCVWFVEHLISCNLWLKALLFQLYSHQTSGAGFPQRCHVMEKASWRPIQVWPNHPAIRRKHSTYR